MYAYIRRPYIDVEPLALYLNLNYCHSQRTHMDIDIAKDHIAMHTNLSFQYKKFQYLSNRNFLK